MPPTSKHGRSVSDPEQTPSERVRALDIAEREAVEAGDWAKLGYVLSEQRTLWLELVGVVRSNGLGAAAAAVAIAQLQEVRQRNHSVIEERSAECRARLSEVTQTREALASYSQVVDRVA